MNDALQEVDGYEAKVYDYSTVAARGIDALEAELVQMPQATQLVVHRFAGGIYSRECYTPKSAEEGKTVVATSRIHRHEHHGVLTLGSVAIWDGHGWNVVHAPHHFITPAGTRRVLMILEDAMCTTFHRTDLTDLAKLDAYLYEPAAGPARHAALTA